MSCRATHDSSLSPSPMDGPSPRALETRCFLIFECSATVLSRVEGPTTTPLNLARPSRWPEAAEEPLKIHLAPATSCDTGHITPANPRFPPRPTQALIQIIRHHRDPSFPFSTAKFTKSRAIKAIGTQAHQNSSHRPPPKAPLRGRTSAPCRCRKDGSL